MPKEEIERLYKKEKDPRVKERLHAILLLLDGKTAIEVAGILRRNERTIRRGVKAMEGTEKEAEDKRGRVTRDR